MTVEQTDDDEPGKPGNVGQPPPAAKKPQARAPAPHADNGEPAKPVTVTSWPGMITLIVANKVLPTEPFQALMPMVWVPSHIIVSESMGLASLQTNGPADGGGTMQPLVISSAQGLE